MKSTNVDPGLLAAIGKTLNEMHGNTAHSYGMEPPVNDYIKGMQRADDRYHAEIHKHLANHDGVSGSFHRPITTGNPNAGEIRRDGSGDLEGYGTHQYNSPPRWPAQQQPIRVTHKGDVVAHVTARKDGGFLIQSGSSGNGMYARADTQEEALRGAALYHKQSKSAINENLDITNTPAHAMHVKVEQHLNHYYGHLKIVDAYRGIGDTEKENKHLQIASDYHSLASAHHKEMSSNTSSDDFSEYKSAARKRSGWKES